MKLDKKHAAKIARWARSRKVTKSDVIRSLIEHSGPVDTGDELAEWVALAEGKGMGFGQKTP